MNVSFLRPLSGFVFTIAVLLATAASILAQSEGTFDLSFNSTGYRYEDFGGGSNEGWAVAVQADGKTIAAGQAEVIGSGTDFAIVRYNPDGSLDASFGTGGKVTTAIGPLTSSDAAFAVAIQADGKIVAAGYADGISGSGRDFAVVRYNSNGTLDASFGVSGKLTTPFGSALSSDASTSLAIQPDGKIIAAGYADDVADSGADFAIARYNDDGSLDLIFDGDGKATTAIGAGTASDLAQAVAIDSAGKIVAAGYTVDATADSVDIALARYNSDGTPDSSFDGDGKVITTIGSSTTFAIAAAVAIQADGKIVAAGFTDDEFLGADFALVRYNVDGLLDGSFDIDGIVTTAISLGTGFDIAQALVIQPDGKIIAAGFTDNSGGGTDLAVVRYNANGSLDNSFNTDGKATIDLGGTEFIRAAAIYSGNRIAIAGSGSDFLTARIWLTTLVTAADVSVNGRVTDGYGRAIRGAILTLTDEKGVGRSVTSNTFGYYRFTRVRSDATYILQVDARRYTFAEPVRVIDARSDVAGMDFVAQDPRRLPLQKQTAVTKGKMVSDLR